ncbi:DNA topoisomerase-1 [Lachnospiraceae bacterium XBB1006]|nr:DNA topoisomerase-1 [Lachnospiraceae bacterium XBB1006]
MAKNLVIVESPAKVKTIKKFLGSNYEVTASNGHVRDLPKSSLGVDIENDYEPKYITIRGKGEVLAKLRKEVKKADKIYLATDPDREGEAISWHLYHALKLADKTVYRISFNEITKQAVKESLKQARKIDMNLVDAQQARRVLDRIVGYRISPLLWMKVKRGLSAGRVQSVALRMICDREEEINAFIPQEYWSIDVKLKFDRKTMVAKFSNKANKVDEIRTKEEADKIKAALEQGSFVVEDVKHGERVKKAPVPFTTSTLQQEAAKVLNFSTQKTMRIAQQLYEGMDVKGMGTVGLITYLRTDSTRVSDEAQHATAEFVQEQYGTEFLPSRPGEIKNKGKVQDAHEAIRPSDVRRVPAAIKESLSRDQFRLYQLIWNRFVASQMADARYDTASCKIKAGDYVLSASTSKVAFPGFMNVYTNDTDEKGEARSLVSALVPGEELSLEEVVTEQHFTQPSPHYTEASLVKAMEEIGIGRPSTYAPTISTIIARRYITKENKNLYVTELGEVVNRIMKDAFTEIVDETFTAGMEEELDKVAEGEMDWKDIVRKFYPDFEKSVEAAERDLEKVTIADELSDEFCEVCGRQMVIKYGPHGRFLACPGFPDCRFTKPYLEKQGIPCPKCGKEIVLRKTKKGRKFFGCENNPDCDFMSWQKPSKDPCPKCGGYMVEKGNKLVCADEKCGFIQEKGVK